MENKEKTLTVFTCTYNRAHTIGRTYESMCRQTSQDFEWLVIDDGSTDNTSELLSQWMKEEKIAIRYVKKENGGLYTGYNTAIEHMKSKLCIAIDSDDFMPDDAVENIIRFWNEHGSDQYAGLIGLDSYSNGQPIGGYFPENLKSAYISELYKYHAGDTKMVHRVELLKQVAPMEGYPGEKFANPIYLFLKVDLLLPMLITNTNLCIVEYQEASDSMSKNILYQYVQSPRSFARMRLLNMSNKRIPYKMRFRNAIHYVSSCMIAKDGDWLKKSPMKLSTILAAPFGALLYLYIMQETKKKRNTYS